MIAKARWYLVAMAASIAAAALAYFVIKARADADFYLLKLGGEGTHIRVPAENIGFLPTNSRQNPIGNYAGLKIPSPDALADSVESISITLRDKSSLRDQMFAEAISPSGLIGDSPDGLFEVYRGGYGTSVHEFLVPKDQNPSASEYRTILDCGPYVDASQSKRLWPYCQAYASDNDRFHVLYNIPGGDLADWRTIEVDVLAFVRTLIVDCFDAEFPAPDTASMQFHACGQEPSR